MQYKYRTGLWCQVLIFVRHRYFNFFDNFVVRRTHLSKGLVLNFVVHVFATITSYERWGRHLYSGITQSLNSLDCAWRLTFYMLILWNPDCDVLWRVKRVYNDIIIRNSSLISNQSKPNSLDPKHFFQQSPSTICST